MSREYLVEMRHTDRTRSPEHVTFIVPAFYAGHAAIIASDRYRDTFGQPERGTSPGGFRWVNCDFMFVRETRYVPLVAVCEAH